MRLTHLSLCSGIGGLDLAAEWACFTTVAQCEIDGYASRTLLKNFKGVHNFGDIRTITTDTARTRAIKPGELTLISAGLPCQPYSLAGKGKGDGDERDLWHEVARCIRELKPRWFVGENTPGLFSRKNGRYFSRVVNGLSSMGYSVSWGMWGACDVGANHKRDRVFIVGHSNSINEGVEQKVSGRMSYQSGRDCSHLADADSQRQLQPQRCEQDKRKRISDGSKTISDSRSEWQAVGRLGNRQENKEAFRSGADKRRDMPKHDSRQWWQTEPAVGRVVDGIPSRVDRLRCLGNAVVPQQAYPIFETIAEYEKSVLNTVFLLGLCKAASLGSPLGSKSK